MKPLELVADVLLVIGACLAIAAASVISLALGLAVGALLFLVSGAVLTALAMKQPKRTKLAPGARGPFEPDTAERS